MGSARLANHRLHLTGGACMSIITLNKSRRLNDGLHSLYRRKCHWASESTTSVLIPVVVITVSHWYDFDRKSLSPAVGLEMHCRNSYPIDGVKGTRVGPTLRAG